LELKGAVALVTGGAKGLGLAISTYLQEQGAKVIVVDIDADALTVLPVKMEGCVLDVTRLDDARTVVKELVERHGRIE
jgi:3-oxoacyl-[acyl-carrier protein] reductase